MTEQEALKRMVPPGAKRPRKWMGGVIQVHVTRACDNSCFNCTQGSNLGGKTYMITPENFEIAVKSLKGYFGVVGVFGGNPATHPQFPLLCEILRNHIPKEQCGLWCNNPISPDKAIAMWRTFNPRYSNLNVHLNKSAYEMFKQYWPESMPFGLDKDSRHSPVHLAMKDVLPDEGKRWELISNCDINQHWSAMVGQFRGEVRAWFCEVAGAQSILHQDDPNYPDTGIPIPPPIERETLTDGTRTDTIQEYRGPWWKAHMGYFVHQVRKHCHECGVPLRGYGELAMGEDGIEQTSETHKDIFKPKRPNRQVEIVTELVQLGTKRVGRVIDYVQNAKV